MLDGPSSWYTLRMMRLKKSLPVTGLRSRLVGTKYHTAVALHIEMMTAIRYSCPNSVIARSTKESGIRIKKLKYSIIIAGIRGMRSSSVVWVSVLPTLLLKGKKITNGIAKSAMRNSFIFAK